MPRLPEVGRLVTADVPPAVRIVAPGGISSDVPMSITVPSFTSPGRGYENVSCRTSVRGASTGSVASRRTPPRKNGSCGDFRDTVTGVEYSTVIRSELLNGRSMPADRAATASTAAGPVAGAENAATAACTAAFDTAPTRNTNVTGCDGRTVSMPPMESSPVKAYSPGGAPGLVNRSAAPPLPIVTAIRRSSGCPSEAARVMVRRI